MMKRANDAKVMGTMADYITQKLKNEKNGLENAIEYLRSAFLSSAVDALFYARRKAGLTQEQVAQKLGKKQEAIARWESDTEGKMSLRQYFDLAIASGRVPLNIVLEPVESVRDFVIDHPEEPQTPYSYYAWLQKHSEPISVLQPTTVHALTPQAVTTSAANLVLPTQGSPLQGNLVVNLEQTLKDQYWSQAGQALVQWPDLGVPNTTPVSQLSTLPKPQAIPPCAPPSHNNS